MRVIRKIWNAINTLVVAAVVLLAVALVGVRLVGLTPYAVLSGSMEPTYHVGSLIYVKEIAPEEIQAGTPITFAANSSGLLVTHRVIAVEKQTTSQEPAYDANGQMLLDASGSPVLREVPLEEPVYYFETKGDANEAADGAKVHHRNVVGTPVLTIPYLGYLSSWMQTPRGMIIGSSIALALLLITFIPDIADMLSDNPAPKTKTSKRASPKKAKTAAKPERAPKPERVKRAGQSAQKMPDAIPEGGQPQQQAGDEQAQSEAPAPLPPQRTAARRRAQTLPEPQEAEAPAAQVAQTPAEEAAEAAPRRRRRRQIVPQESGEP